jgi:hypothetical protein
MTSKQCFILFWSSDEKYLEVVQPVIALLSESKYRNYFGLIDCVRDPKTKKYPAARKQFGISEIPSIITIKNGKTTYCEGDSECIRFIDNLSTRAQETQETQEYNQDEENGFKLCELEEFNQNNIEFTPFNESDFAGERREQLDKRQMKKDVFKKRVPEEKLNPSEITKMASFLQNNLKMRNG